MDIFFEINIVNMFSCRDVATYNTYADKSSIVKKLRLSKEMAKFYRLGFVLGSFYHM